MKWSPRKVLDLNLVILLRKLTKFVISNVKTRCWTIRAALRISVHCKVKKQSSHIKGENSSNSSRMGVKESDQMEELNIGGYPCVRSSMEFDGQNMTSESVLTHKTYVRGHDYSMSLTSRWNGTSAARDIVYKPLGNST